MLKQTCLFMVFSFAAVPAWTNPFHAQCPAELAQDAIKVQPPKAWTQFVPADLPLPGATLKLESVNLTNGPPSRVAILKPDASSRAGDRWDDLDKVQWDGGLWMACGYGPGDFIILGRQVAAGVRQCTLSHPVKTGAMMRCE